MGAAWGMFTLEVFYEDPGPPRETVTVSDLPEVAAQVSALMLRHAEAARIVVSAYKTQLFQVDCRPAPASARTDCPTLN